MRDDMTPEQALETIQRFLTSRDVSAFDQELDIIRAALSRPAVPEGYKLVPETMPDWGAAPPGATHYQPHQDAYYKRVSASEWYVWSRMNDREPMRWHPSLGTGDNAEWVVRPAEAQPDAGLDVEAVLRRFLTGDGFIAECDIQHIVAALTAQPAICGYTCTVPDDCETLHWRGQILSMNELASAAQPAAGEEIMVNTPCDVFTLPLQPSGLDGQGPRFVVHVPAPRRESVTVRYDLSPAQTESAIRDALIRMGWTPPEDGPVAGWRPVAAHRPRYGQRVLLRRSGVVQIVAPTFDGGDDGDFWNFFGIDSEEVDWESDEWMPLDDLGGCLDAVKAERDALREQLRQLEQRDFQELARANERIDALMNEVRTLRDDRRAAGEQVRELVEIIGCIKQWDISNQLLNIPHPLRKRMQAVLAATQEGKS